MNNLEAIKNFGEQMDRMLLDEMKSDKYSDGQKQLLCFASCSTGEALELVNEVIGDGNQDTEPDKAT